MTRLADLDTPALLVNHGRLSANIAAMAEFAREHGVALRPHIKTHKCPEIARMQVAAGASGLTCAKLGEAEVMAEHGFTDILIAYPLVGPPKLRRLLALAERVRVTALVDTPEGALALSEAARAAGRDLDVVIKIDTGLHRCGVLPGEPALALARQVAALPRLRLHGILTHAGHSYGASDTATRERIGRYEGEAMVDTARLLQAAGIPVTVVSVGSTPTVRISGAVPGVTEIRPGNYVFLDRTQVALGVATPGQCALTVLARVVSTAPGRAVIDAGSKVLTLDRGAHGTGMVAGYGCIADRPALTVERLSEEHGVLAVPQGERPLRVGDLVEILPNHSCVVANNFDFLWVREGERAVEQWAIPARGKIT